MMENRSNFLRTFVFAIGIILLIVQTVCLVAIFLLMRNVEQHVTSFIDWLSANQVVNLSSTARSSAIQKSGDYIAIPITVNVVLFISHTLLIWASALKIKLLLWPWMILHALELIVLLASLVLVLIITPLPWFKVVVFLVGFPAIIMLAFFWSVVKSFYTCLRDLNIKSAVAAVYLNGHKHHVPYTGPATVYMTEPKSWDPPAPVWANRPHFGSAWDSNTVTKPYPRFQLNDNQAAHFYGGRPTKYPYRAAKDTNDLQQENVATMDIDGPESDDSNSVCSMSDKYRQQEEVEIFHEEVEILRHNPPEPVRPEG